MCVSLIISDLHEPFEHKKAFEHCCKIRDLHKARDIINIGDIFDHHQLSRHISEPDALGAVQEFELTMKKLRKWKKEFPVMDIVIGNHDAIPRRQAKEMGIPMMFLKKLDVVYEFPKGWKIHKRLVRDDVLYLHIGGSGQAAAMNKARKMSMSVVCGHTHQWGGVQYFSNPNKLFFGMNVGCLIDKDAYAMRYADSEPTLGCGVVYNASRAHFQPLKLT